MTESGADPDLPLPPAATEQSSLLRHRPQMVLLLKGSDRRGLLRDMTEVISRHGGYILSVEIVERGARSAVSWELEGVAEPEGLEAAFLEIAGVEAVERLPSMFQVYGKRIIVVGGGAQVGQVAIGAVSEADRHNIRGEHISVDTIPLVGEQTLADAVRAVARLPRAKALVLAGALMGGEIERAVREVRQAGLLVISLNMAGSVPEAADLVVTDPVQAGVMAVMAVADTAKFTIERLKRKVF
jgi:energy-converting hydrogenase B subunit Q